MATFFHSKAGKSAIGVEDMVLLTRMQDEDVAENLRKRHAENVIYTYIGPILVSVNPYKHLDIYGPTAIEHYKNSAIHENPPHVYGVTDLMYRQMLSNNEDQCVIISGESGAGKTETAKYVMNFLAAISGNNTEMESMKHIILESNPLLEAMGNAKTLRNNNSSRFGKYFEIQFSQSTGAPVGGRILNFLLEKSRVVGQKQGERSFHIFYQFLQGATQTERQQYGLMRPEDYHYLNQSGTFDAAGINDAKELVITRHAMQVCGITEQNQQHVFCVLAAILHLGNIEFKEEHGGKAQIADNAALEFPAYLLGVSTDMLSKKLLTRKMTAASNSQRSSTYDVELNVNQANYTRDALSKALYDRLFNWVVTRINRTMQELGKVNDTTSIRSIGVLDIYGFEIFEQNGFSQFCINYVNEKLQQIFIELTLKSEQEEYVSEGIHWTPVKYFNNKIVLDLIEGKKDIGVMAVLDDLCATMHGQSDGADNQFGQKLNDVLAEHPSRAHFVSLQDSFILKHYAGEVSYCLEGFVDANRDVLFKDLILLMKSTDRPFIATLFSEDVDTDDRRRPTTASFKIRNHATLLVETLSRCVPHYIRCIKPNETKMAGDWAAQQVAHQVQYLNLVENIRIRRAGYAYRESFDKFLTRFGILTRETYPSWMGGEKSHGVAHILNYVKDIPSNGWQLGRTKVFIKAPESLFLLEDLREKEYSKHASTIQRAWRRYKARQHYMQLRTMIDSVYQGKKERRRFSVTREYRGDYLGVKMRPDLKTFVSARNEKILFSNTVRKYDRKFRSTLWDIIITDRCVLLVGEEKVATKGTPPPGLGLKRRVLKRQLPFAQIQAISLSTHADDFFILHCPDYDYCMGQFFKTEMLAIFMNAYSQQTGRPCDIRFANELQFRVKKMFWERSGKRTIKFEVDSTVSAPKLYSKGKRAIVHVPPGIFLNGHHQQSYPTTGNNFASATIRTIKSPAGLPPSPTKYQPVVREEAPFNPNSNKLKTNVGSNHNANGSWYTEPGQPLKATNGTKEVPNLTNTEFVDAPYHKNATHSYEMNGTGPTPTATQVDLQQHYAGEERTKLKNAGLVGIAQGGSFSSPSANSNWHDIAQGSAKKATIAVTPQQQINGGGTVSPQALLPPPKPKLVKAAALYDYAATEIDELSFASGDVITILDQRNNGWWQGILRGKKGLLPSNYVNLLEQSK